MDLIYLGYEPWKTTLHVRSVHFTIIVKLVSITLNSRSNTVEFQIFTGGVCGACVF